VASDQFPPELKAFVARHLHSTAELEVLLLLHRSRSEVWTPERAAEALRMPVPWTAEQLVKMQEAGLAAPEGAGFRYQSDGPSARTVDQLATAYRDRKTRVVSLLYSSGSGGSDAESFADAFRLKRRGRERD